MMEEYLWGFSNPVPLRAVFTNGQSTPVVGFAAVRGEIAPNSDITDTMMCGIAIFNHGLVFCERFDDFIGYGDPTMTKDPKTGEMKNECQEIYENWVKEQQQGFEGNETVTEPGMRIIRTGIDDQDGGGLPADSEPGVVEVDGNRGPNTTE